MPARFPPNGPRKSRDLAMDHGLRLRLGGAFGHARFAPLRAMMAKLILLTVMETRAPPSLQASMRQTVYGFRALVPS
jgi:hypothetical protein